MNKPLQRTCLAVALALACGAGFAQGVGNTGAAAGPGAQSRGDKAIDCNAPGASSDSACNGASSATSASGTSGASSSLARDMGESVNGWDRTTGDSRSRAANSTGNNSTGTDDSSNENNKSGGQ